ncbi:MAG TPA: hypothetical protein VL944_03095 [Candidatus Acidoferrum sp.]|nr:hypothetical protein [Candidatus Acidoferrum sp.]
MSYHTYLTLLLPSVVAFVMTIIATLFVMDYMFDAGVTDVDHNKKKEITLPGGVGIAFALGLTIGILVYVFGSNFPTPTAPFYQATASLTYLFATVLAVLLISLVGFLDDINVRTKGIASVMLPKGLKHKRGGLKQWQKPLLTFIGAIPLMVVNAGMSIVHIPFVGAVNFGILYPLIIIPLAVIFAANSVNLLGGFDGIATGTTMIVALALVIYGLLYGTYTGTLIASVAFSACLALFVFNVYPSKMIPGDSFTYGIGAVLVSAMVLGNMESFGVIIAIPFIIEFLLHARKRFKVTDLGKKRSDMTMEPPYGKKIYSWCHLFMNMKRCKEWEVSMYMWIVEIGFVVLAFALKALALL